MKTVEFKFDLDQKVTVEKIGFTGIITLCGIQGEPAEKTYFIQGQEKSHWFPERLLKEVE